MYSAQARHLMYEEAAFGSRSDQHSRRPALPWPTSPINTDESEQPWVGGSSDISFSPGTTVKSSIIVIYVRYTASILGYLD